MAAVVGVVGVVGVVVVGVVAVVVVVVVDVVVGAVGLDVDAESPQASALAATSVIAATAMGWFLISSSWDMRPRWC